MPRSRDALSLMADQMSRILDGYPRRTLSVDDEIVELASKELGLTPAESLTVVRQQLSAMLATSELEDGYLLAAAWLTAQRPLTPEQVRRDTDESPEPWPYGGTLEDALRNANQQALRFTAYLCLKRRTEAWRTGYSRDPRSLFNRHRGDHPAPRTASIALALETALSARISELAQTPPTQAAADPNPPATTPASDIQPPLGDDPADPSTPDTRSTEQVADDQPVADADPNPDVAPVPVEEPSKKKRIRLSRGGVFAARVAAFLALGGALTTAALSGAFGSGAPVTAETKVHTFTPGEKYDTIVADLPEGAPASECWERSYVSARADARLCAVGGAEGGTIQDPCFSLADDAVVCFRPPDPYTDESTPGAVTHVTGVIPGPDYLSEQSVVGAEWADETRYPWSFTIDYSSAAPYVCAPSLSPSDMFGDVTFTCREDGVRPIISLGDQQFADGQWVAVRQAGEIEASNLDRSRATWTVEIADPATNTLEQVNVLDAWF